MKNLHLDHENRPRKYGVTPDDLKDMQQRRIEAAERRQAEDAGNDRRAAALGQALRVLKGEALSQ